MKWENHVCVVECANIPKFCKLNDTVTLLRPLELSFDDILVDMTAVYPKLYSHREKPDISFKIANEKI